MAFWNGALTGTAPPLNPAPPRCSARSTTPRSSWRTPTRATRRWRRSWRRSRRSAPRCRCALGAPGAGGLLRFFSSCSRAHLLQRARLPSHPAPASHRRPPQKQAEDAASAARVERVEANARYQELLGQLAAEREQREALMVRSLGSGGAARAGVWLAGRRLGRWRPPAQEAPRAPLPQPNAPRPTTFALNFARRRSCPRRRWSCRRPIRKLSTCRRSCAPPTRRVR